MYINITANLLLVMCCEAMVISVGRHV